MSILEKISYKTILAIFFVVFVFASIPFGIYLVRQRQELRKEAAVPTGEATVSLSPTNGSYQLGETFPISVFFNTADIPISAVTIRLAYPYDASLNDPEVVASDIEINSSLLTTGDWSCPIKTITPTGTQVEVDIACINTNISGFATSTDTRLISFNMVANQIPASNPVVLTFDATQSIITRKSNGQDILLIPTSTGSYTITDAGEPTLTPTTKPTITLTPTLTPTIQPGTTATLTPTPTEPAGASPTITLTPTLTPTIQPGTTATLTPTVTNTLTPTQTLTPTIQPGTTATLTPTTSEELPETAITTPTLIFLGVGLILVLIASLIII